MSQVQTSPQGTFPVKFKSALAEMHDNKATTGFPFGSLVPLWSRQIPYTMTKFYFFEKVRPIFQVLGDFLWLTCVSRVAK